MTRNRLGAAFTVAGTLFIIGGIALLGLAAADGLVRLGVFENRDLTAPGTITEVDPTGNMIVSFTTQEGRDVVFETASLSDPPDYDPPYAQGETIMVAYNGKSAVDATIADSREWIRIATLGLFAAIVILWGWAGVRFGAVGVFAGLALWFGFSAFGQAAIAGLLGF
jgi:hypothetical protein